MNFKHTLAALTGLLLLIGTGCNKLDNYDAPNGGIQGRIVDAKTGELIQLPVNASTGLRIRLTQQNWSTEADADAQLLYANDDGTFTNTKLFNDEYSLELEQTNFFPVEKKMIQINGQTETTIQVTPFCYASVSNPSLKNRRIQAEVSLNRNWDWKTDNRDCKITQVCLYTSVSSHIDKENANNMGGKSIDYSQISDEDLLAEGHKVTAELLLDGAKLEQYAHIIKANNNKIFIRAAVVTKCDGQEYYNYSDIQTLEFEED